MRRLADTSTPLAESVDPRPAPSRCAQSTADLWLSCARRIGLGYGVGVGWIVQLTPVQRSINCSAVER
jgi:hypothetical protein